MPATAETLHKVKSIIRTSLRLEDEPEFPDDMPLVGGEYDMDSLDILLIITNIEREFVIKVQDGRLNKQVFTSIRTLADFVEAVRG